MLIFSFTRSCTIPSNFIYDLNENDSQFVHYQLLWVNFLTYCFIRVSIQSLMHILCVFRDIFMEKHWKSAISRSVCDYFFNQQRNISSPEDIPPVIATPHHYLISIYRSNMYFVVVCMTDGKIVLLWRKLGYLSRTWNDHFLSSSCPLVPPLFVIEFLHRVVDTFDDYFSECTESIIKENYVVVYEVRVDFRF